MSYPKQRRHVDLVQNLIKIPELALWKTTEFLTDEWLRFIDGRESMKNVVAAYDRNNFDTNQDLPGFTTFLPYLMINQKLRKYLLGRNVRRTWR